MEPLFRPLVKFCMTHFTPIITMRKSTTLHLFVLTGKRNARFAKFRPRTRMGRARRRNVFGLKMKSRLKSTLSRKREFNDLLGSEKQCVSPLAGQEKLW